MSVFVGAYVSTWDVWPDQLPALTLTAGFVRGQRGPSGLGRAEPTLLTAAGEGARHLVQGRGDTSTPPCPSRTPRGATGRCWGVGDRLPGALACLLEDVGDLPTIMAGAAGTGCMSAWAHPKGWGIYIRGQGSGQRWRGVSPTRGDRRKVCSSMDGDAPREMVDGGPAPCFQRPSPSGDERVGLGSVGSPPHPCCCLLPCCVCVAGLRWWLAVLV